MTNGGEPKSDQELERELGGLKERYEKLREEKVRTEEQLDGLEKRLDEVKARAREEYGSDDPGELARLLEEKRAENARLVAEYREHLEAIDQGLRQAEEAAGGGAEDTSGNGEDA
ncbi:hypothetical protein [Desulfohalovibrio reitneri]|uniref:hypothetical protein n=1 Tax=Desulfohalovibrio reitneri TaxID=1307759 RepID=UPI000556B95A|nr:hypothetical protein [Desulfohalovibrio reitneri]